MITNFDKHPKVLKYSWLDTKIGPMIAISDDKDLYLLEFIDGHDLEREIKKFKIKTFATIVPGSTDPIKSITFELQSYFDGGLTEFKTPLCLLGSPFQRLVWEELVRIPYGVTRTYAEQSKAIGKHSAYRAVASANGANQLAIIVPCHRIINSNGAIGGYKGGTVRKKWLIDHEQNIHDQFCLTSFNKISLKQLFLLNERIQY